MAQTAGYQGIIKIATTPTPTTTLGQINNQDLSINADMYDVTFMGDRAKDFLAGLYSGAVSCKVNYDKTDAVQAIVEAAILAGTLLYMIFTPANAVSNTNYSFTAYVKDYKVNDPVNNVVSTDITFQPTAAITAA